MADFMVLIAVFAIFIICFYYERKEKNREENEYWINERRQCLVGITYSFRRDCQEAADKAFTQYTNVIQHKIYRKMPYYITNSFLSDYRETIDKLKEDYIENVTIKAKERCYTSASIPNYLIEEYSKQIDIIYGTFYDFEHLMWHHITEAKEKE